MKCRGKLLIKLLGSTQTYLKTYLGAAYRCQAHVADKGMQISAAAPQEPGIEAAWLYGDAVFDSVESEPTTLPEPDIWDGRVASTLR